MKVIISLVFQVVCFPFQDLIVTIDHMSFDNYGSSASLGLTILDIDNSQPATENVGVGLYASLIGTFNILVPILDISSTPCSDSSPMSSAPFCTMYVFGGPMYSSFSEYFRLRC